MPCVQNDASKGVTEECVLEMKLFFFLFISISLPDYCILMDTVLLIVVCAVTLTHSLTHSNGGFHTPVVITSACAMKTA